MAQTNRLLIVAFGLQAPCALRSHPQIDILYPAMPGRFSVSQIVEVEAMGFGEGARLQTGDRGTVVREASRNKIGGMEVAILWHKNLTESTVPEDRLRVYVNPMDAPGRAKASFETMRALSVVLREEMPHAMEEIKRDLERARMTAEDYAQGNARITIGAGLPTSWRKSCGDYSDYLYQSPSRSDRLLHYDRRGGTRWADDGEGCAARDLLPP